MRKLPKTKRDSLLRRLDTGAIGCKGASDQAKLAGLVGRRQGREEVSRASAIRKIPGNRQGNRGALRSRALRA